MRVQRDGRKCVNRLLSAAAFAFLLFATSAPATAHLPVILIYGFQPVPGFRATEIWQTFAEVLSGNNVHNAEPISVSDDHEFYLLSATNDEHRDVILSNPASPIEPTVRDIVVYVRRFATEIATLSAQRSMTRFDIVAHSMGGLIARAYIESDDLEGDVGFAYGGEIRTLVMLATPNHGSEVASLGEWFSTLSRQLAPGSDFLRTLNELRWSDGALTALNPAVRYVSLAGQTCLGCGLRLNEDACRQGCVDEGLAWHGSDLVVTMSSAYLPEAENCAAIGYDHIAMHADRGLAAAVIEILSGSGAPAVVYADGYETYRRP